VPEIDRHRYRIECSNRIMFKQELCGCDRTITVPQHPRRSGLWVLGEPRRANKIWDALDRVITESRKNRGQIVTHGISCWWVAVRLTNNCRVVESYQRTRGVAFNFSQTDRGMQ
jgi:hypothetical protein